MCGIVGAMRFDASTSAVPLQQMAGTLLHRGPDAIGFWESGQVQLGHTRLSIIDVADSAQPMTSHDGRFVLVFNGEIFNYRALRAEMSSYPFRTQGDTEVLLAGLSQRGADFVPRLRGQFAFAFYDTREGSLLLGRDRLGILPLVYTVSPHRMLFASEVKALLPAVQPQMDAESLDAFLAYGSVPAPFTLFRGVRKLLPGHTLRIGRDGTRSLAPFIDPPQARAPQRWADTEAVGALDTTLRGAVDSALVADVPVGAYLSGGLDSSLIVALMRNLRPEAELLTFSAGFGDPRFDETRHAGQVAHLCRTQHHQVDVRPADFVELWSHLTWHRDAPLSQPADVAVYRLAQLARQHVKVVLSGEGSDELFAGYPKYSAARLTGAAGLLHQLGPGADACLHTTRRLRIAQRAALAYPGGEAVRSWFAPFPAWQRRAMLSSTPHHPLPAYPRSGRGPVSDIQVHDLQTWLPDNLLERGDRMSMAASLELRPPFLDNAVVDLALGLPTRLMVRGGDRKWIVKRVADLYLPDSIVGRRKVGFRVPLDTWFRDGLADLTHDLLQPASFVSQIFDQDVVHRLVESHLTGRSNEERAIWTLLGLEVWHQTFLSGPARHAVRTTAS